MIESALAVLLYSLFVFKAVFYLFSSWQLFVVWCILRTCVVLCCYFRAYLMPSLFLSSFQQHFIDAIVSCSRSTCAYSHNFWCNDIFIRKSHSYWHRKRLFTILVGNFCHSAIVDLDTFLFFISTTHFKHSHSVSNPKQNSVKLVAVCRFCW